MASAQEFFAVSAGVAGALIGLLFVAISVAPERVLGPEAQEVHAVRAAAALTAFTNALAVSLFSLIPGLGTGGAATAVAVVGLLFMLGALVRLIPLAHTGEIHWRELSFLAGLLVVFVIQLLTALKLDGNERNHDAQQTICILVAVCFLLGIARAWELVGGPRMSIFTVLLRRRSEADEPEEL
ncbi:MAG TPA: hypothetical protein VH061_14855 [Solirubrobacteraceae bacterium]|jgi:hypothetical protein|nr:hypothetical protein [Solirubrobacteraceae bacterium]